MAASLPESDDNNIIIIDVDPPTAEAKRLWGKVLELAEAFGGDENWTLVGGLMVQLHGYQYGSTSRPTVDIDLLGNSRSRPPGTKWMAEVLTERGAEMAMPPVGDDKLGYRFELDGEVIEVLGSEGVRGDPVGKYTTFKVPGGTQALRRSEVVGVSLGGDPAVDLRRPNLLGAILIKARVVAKQRKEKFESDRQDLIRLLSFVEDPRGLAESDGLKKTEKKWLTEIEALLDFRDTSLTIVLPPEDIGRAELAYRLLTA